MLHKTIRLQAIAIALATLVLAGCGSKKLTEAPPPPPPTPAPVQTAPPPPPTRPAPQLAGAIGVMVENSPQSRPQAGLDKAEVVYEMEAEGGISRFLALYYGEKADKIGPVRSARMGFYDVATAYGIPYAHAGGNNDVLLVLKAANPKLLNLDEINTCGNCFWRSNDRQPPHNLYTKTDSIVERSKAIGFPLKPLVYFPEGGAMAGGKPIPVVAFSWGEKTQQVEWTWNGKRFERSQAGEPHVLENGARIAADNLVVLFTKFAWDGAAQWGEGQNNISIIGSGSGYLYRDGKGYPIRWSKGARDEHYKLTTAEGGKVELTMGQTWVEVLKAKEHVAQGIPE